MAFVCAICDLTLSTAEAVIVTRGKRTLIEKSKYLDDDLWKKIEDIVTVRIHEKCRKTYLIKKKVESVENIDSSQPSASSLRSSNVLEKFDFKTQCLFCTEECNKSANKKSNRKFRVVTTLQIKNNIEGQCRVLNNELARQVFTRINSSIDLVAAEGRYHKSCHDSFFKPLKDTQPGRPSDKLCDAAFSSLCTYINDNLEVCQFSLKELHEKMESYLPTENKECMWSKSYLKDMLIACYQDRVNTTIQAGKNLILTFKEYAEKILNDQWYNSRKKDEESERIRIITAAAKILREDIRTHVYEMNAYPSNAEFQNGGKNSIPNSLKIFLRTLFNQTSSDKENPTTERKMLSLSNAVISIIRPRSYISPVLLGLGIHLHRKFGSKDLLSILHALGFVSHYKSIMLYENAAAEVSVNISIPSFIQFAFDNADFNIRTLDGFGTFHAMGGVMVVTPENAITIDPLHKKPRNQLQAGQFGTAPIAVYHKPPIPGLSKIKVEKLSLFKPESLRASCLLNYLWAYGQMNNFQPNSSWQGYMSAKMQGKDSQNISKVIPLPFVNLDPTNPTAIYSSLMFAIKLCKQYNMKTCIATFDQPLFLKATEIISASNPEDDLSKVVVRLGSFHLIMSFMGAIGFIMSGSGLAELWATIYAGNSIPHLINGHAYSRALRAHLLTQSALTQLLLKNENISEYFKNELEELYNPNNEINNVIDHPVLNSLLDGFEQLLKTTETSNRTAKLWCQYWHQVEILKMTIKADRTGDWSLHLFCANSMLPYFHAAGHLPYAKSCHLYVQKMLACKDSMHPEDYRKMAQEDCHVVRRNDKFWSGTPLDMIIEQELMRRMKTSGGLTHGRGITDSTLSRWISGMPQCLQVSEALENFSGVITVASEQHVELRSSRIERDQQDLCKLIDWLEIRNPFDPDIEGLMSISSGVVANSDVNCDKAAEIGEKVISRIIGTNYNILRLKRNDRVKPLLSGISSVKIKGEQITVDPALLFSRILCSASSPEEIKRCFKYELAPSSPSLFDNGSLRKTTKSTLYKIFDKLHPPLLQKPDSITHYVIDGGHLLHKVVWQNPAIFSDLFSQYYNYITYHYGKNVTVVFDGYEEIQTKIVEQNRRSAGKKMVPIVSFSNLSAVKVPKADFLSNNTNKSNFIRALGKVLLENGINVKFADGDADTLIVTTAVAISDNLPEGTVAVVSEDTDIIVLLIHYCHKKMFMIRPGKVSKPNKIIDIPALQQKLGDLKNVILSVHAISGCDTTSAVFNKGKINLVNTIQKKKLCELLKEFYNPEATKEKLEEVTSQFFIAAYVKNSTKKVDLDSARYMLYQQYVAKRSLNTNFNLASLPPTSNSAKYHGLRVFHQVS